jgi:hypothetical protein
VAAPARLGFGTQLLKAVFPGARLEYAVRDLGAKSSFRSATIAIELLHLVRKLSIKMTMLQWAKADAVCRPLLTIGSLKGSERLWSF